MKSLSIRQPWAWLIVNGFKPVENRTWATNFRGEFLVHASQKTAFDAAGMVEFAKIMAGEAGIFIPADLPVGGIVGMADLVDCTIDGLTDANDIDWHEPGMCAFVLRNARPLDFMAVKGKLNFFEVHYPDPHSK